MLSKDEKELLTVIRYVNSKKEETKKLLIKMMGEMTLAEICQRTGYNGHQVRSIVPIKESDKIVFKSPVEKRCDIDSFLGKQRYLLEAILDLIDSGHPAWRAGEIMPTQDEIVEQFDIYRKAVINVTLYLRTNGHIRHRNPRNPRTGYIIVKGR